MKKRSIEKITFRLGDMTVHLADGRRISTPLKWYPRLLEGTAKQRANWQEIGAGRGIHWPDLDEDLSMEGLLHSVPSVEYRKPRRAKSSPPELRV